MTDFKPTSIPESELLALCPKCKYQLCGLPVKHRCPECGIEINRDWKLFGAQVATQDTRKPFRLGRTLAFGFLGYSTVVLIAAFKVTGIRQMEGVCCYSVMWGLALMSVLMFRHSNVMMALGPEGMIYLRDFTTQWSVEWSKLKRARVDITRKCVVVETTLVNEIRLPFGKHFRFHIGEADRFVREFNSYPR